MKHYGDITKINGAEVEPVDVITGGSPCQDLSVAGKRAGLAGERSGLFMEQIRIIKEMRKHGFELRGSGADEPIRPRYMVWENVYGAFSSNGGEDFRAVLEETAKVAQGDAVIPQLADGQKWSPCGYIMGDRWSIAWRGHDAQYWGVPQRRKRICLVADFDGHSAPFILFDPQYRGETEYASTFQTVGDFGNEPRSEVQSVSESVSGNTEQSGSQRERTAGATADGIGKAISFQERAGKPGGGKGILIQDERTGALSTLTNQSVCLNPWDVQSKHIQPQDGTAEALYSGECRGGGGESYVMTIDEKMGNTYVHKEQGNTLAARDYKQPQAVVKVSEPILLESNQNHATVQTDGISTSLPASMGMGGGYTPMVCQEPISFTTEMTPKTDENGVGFSLRSRDYKDPQGVVCIGNGQVAQLAESEVVGALNCMHDQQAVMTYGLDRASFNQGQNAKFDFSVEEEVAPTVVSRGPGGVLAKQ